MKFEVFSKTFSYSLFILCSNKSYDSSPSKIFSGEKSSYFAPAKKLSGFFIGARVFRPITSYDDIVSFLLLNKKLYSKEI